MRFSFLPIFILKEAFLSFRRDNCPQMAASLAFYTFLALIPLLFLIAYFSGVLLGSSGEALGKIQVMLKQFIPAYSDIIIKEVKNVIAFKKGLGIINLFLLFSAILPLASSIRTSLHRIFRIEFEKSVLSEKLIDSIIILLFIITLVVIALKDILISIINSLIPFLKIPFFLSSLLPGLIVFLFTFFLYIAFTFEGWKSGLTLPATGKGQSQKSKNFLWSPLLFDLPDITRGFRVKVRYLVAGAIVTAVLWFGLKPAFNLMLRYNPGYGFTFGSFKSLFIIIIWIYYSQIVFLFGAEVSACFNRKEAIMLKRALDKNSEAAVRVLPPKIKARYVDTFKAGEIIFNEGEQSDKMYYILRGKVAIEKGGKEIAVIDEGSYIGEMAFLLNKPRTASARAIEDTELLIIDYQNIETLSQEMPEFFKDILKEMASRLERTSEAF